MARPVVVPIRGDVRGLETALRSIDGRVAKTQQGLDRFGRVLTGVLAGGAALRGLQSVVTTTAEFDTTIREAGSAAGASRREMDLLARSARQLGVQQKLGAVGATEAAKAQRELIKAGLSVKDALGGATRAVLTAASADGADITRTAEAVSQALMMFEMRGKDASKVADQFATVAATTSSSIEGVAESFVTGSAAAKGIGMSFKDTNVTLAALALAGTKGAEAGTAMKSAFMQLAKPTEAAQAVMKKYGLQLFDSNNNLKSATQLAAQLEKGLGGLTGKQRTATLQTLAGTYGYRTLAALMQQGADGTARLTTEMRKQGTAAKMAAERNAGLGGTLAAAKAGWQELKLAVGEAIAPEATAALESLTKKMQAAGRSGELKELLGDVGAGLGTIVQVGESAARVGGAVVKAWAGVPRPMRDAAAAMLVAAVAANKLGAATAMAGLGGAGGVAGRLGRPGQVVTPLMVPGVGLRGMPGMYQLQRSFGDSRFGSMLTATGARGLGMRSAAGMAGAGVLGGVLGGGNALQAGASGAMAGAMLGGPWGAAGGAIAAAAGTALVGLLKGRAADAAAEMGRRAGAEVRNAIGENLDGAAVRSLTKLRTETAKLRAELDKANADGQNKPGDDRSKYDKWAAASRREGSGLAAGWKRRVGGVKNLNVTSLAEDFIGRAEKLDQPGQKVAARQATAYIRELERQGKLTKGATDRFRRRLQQQLSTDIKGTAKAELRVDLKKDAGKTADELKRKLQANGKLSIDVDVPVKGDLDIENLVKTAKKQRKQLDDIAKGRTGAGKEERAQAQAARKELDRLTAAFERKTKKGRERAAANVLKAEGAAARAGAPELDKYAEAMKRAAAARALYEAAGDGATLELVPPPTPGSPGDRQRRRRGGLIRAFRGGGEVPVAVSSGEAIQFPNGAWGMVPGAPVAADNVLTTLPVGAKVFTGHGQALMAAGASPAEALREQLPHFARGGTVGPARVAQAARTAGLSGSRLVTAVAVAGAESGYRPGATNRNSDGSIDRGAWQINSVHKQYDPQRLFELGYNARAMAGISKGGSNWNPWVTFKTGAYKQYLTGARAAAIKTRGGAGEFGDQEYSAPIVLGASKAGRTGLVEDAFSQGFQRGLSGYSYADRKTFGSPILRSISEALASGTYTRRLTARGGGSEGDYTAGGGVSKKGGISGLSKKLQDRFGLSVTSTTGGRHAKNSLHYSGRAHDLAGGRMTEAARWLAADQSRYGKLAEGIHNPGLSVKNGKKVPSSFWGAKTWAGHRDHIHVAMRRGGTVGRFASGGTVKGLGGVNIAGGLGSGGSKFYTALANAADEATYRLVDRRRAELQKVVNSGGDARMVARARASLSILEDALGAKVGRLVGGATRGLTARSQNSNALALLQRRLGTENTAAGIGGQIELERRFQAKVPGLMRDQQVALSRAVRAKDKQAADEARAALVELGNASMEAAANIADLERARAEAAREEAHQRRTAGLRRLDLDAAWASLTETLDDDMQVNARREAEARTALEDARVNGTAEHQIELIGTLNSILDEQKALREEQKQQAAEQQQSLEQQLELTKQALANSEAARRAAESTDFKGLMGHMASGHIGSKANGLKAFPGNRY